MRIEAQPRAAPAGLDRLLKYVARNRRGQLLAAMALGAVVGGGSSRWSTAGPITAPG